MHNLLKANKVNKLQNSKFKSSNYVKNLIKTTTKRKESKMNVKLVATVGFKVLTAVVAGAAVFIGIGQAISGGESKKQPPVNPGGGEGKQPFPPETQKEETTEVKRSSTETISAAIKGAGETCGKLFTFAQSLSMVIDAGSRLFRKDSGYGNPGYYQNGNSYVPINNPQPFTSGNINWVPNGSYVLQAVPNGAPRW